MRILLVEDDLKSARILSRGLREEGFVVDEAHRADAADAAVSSRDYDVLILDWLLPDKPGIEICRELRARGLSMPVIMLTAKDAVEDLVAGLDAGADDYLTKPFAFWELLARIRALLRRGGPSQTLMLTVDDLHLDPVTHRVVRGGRPVKLTAKEYSILELLMRHAGEVVSRMRIGKHVWEHALDDFGGALDVHMSHLRSKIDGNSGRSLIHTVRGRGYRIGPKVD